jgi:hypothetical protein
MKYSKLLFYLCLVIYSLQTNTTEQKFQQYLDWGFHNGVELNKITFKNLTPDNRYVVSTDHIQVSKI